MSHQIVTIPDYKKLGGVFCDPFSGEFGLTCDIDKYLQSYKGYWSEVSNKYISIAIPFAPCLPDYHHIEPILTLEQALCESGFAATTSTESSPTILKKLDIGKDAKDSLPAHTSGILPFELSKKRKAKDDLLVEKPSKLFHADAKNVAVPATMAISKPNPIV